jgi:hypothetical protein
MSVDARGGRLTKIRHVDLRMVVSHWPGYARQRASVCRTCVGPERARLLDGQKVVANLDGVLDNLFDPVLVREDAP